MTIYSAQELEAGGFLFLSQSKKPHPCCATHKKPHDLAVDADACFYAWSMEHIEEFTAPAEFEPSVCQLYPCSRKTRKGLKSALNRHGRYLCDVHRNPAIFAGFLPFSGAGFRIKVDK